MLEELPKTYDHSQERQIYNLWEKNGAFQPKIRSQRSEVGGQKSSLPYFSIIMPPPNANGSLHIGHAVFVTLEDIMTRYHRMNGQPTLWLPGVDHAGFETQVVYQKKLEKEDRNWFTIPRQKLYQEIKDFTLASKVQMEEQFKHLGASCDWTREKFTLDEDIIKIVYQTFKELYDDGLIYRDARIINWCTKHQTTLSDLEVKYVERKDPLYFIKYGPIELATVRPETKFGDTAIAVNPKDKRYQQYIGKEIEIDTLIGKAKIKVIADEAVDPEFGTGAVKVTPAHDPNDFEIWQRHKEEIPGPKIVIDQFGKLAALAGIYEGLNIKDAREKIAQDMAKKNLLDANKTDHNYTHSVATCYKCGRIIEPMILPQWFVAMTKKSKRLGKSLQDLGIEAVKNGEVKFVTKKFEKIYLHWLNNLRDWNISRQIVWGIEIPAWYCPDQVKSGFGQFYSTKCQPIITAGEKPKKCPMCESTDLTRDPDVFDTWFSSGQWPFAALQAQKLTSDFENFYPTTVMETGHDILFFWVARMIMLGKYKTGQTPFTYVYLHGLVRDKDRQKMSKSKGNVIDPLGVIEQYGADALRLALVFGVSGGNDIIISEEKIKGMRNFVNKLWNISRYIMTNIDSAENLDMGDYSKNSKTKTKDFCHYWMNESNKVVENVLKDIEKFNFHIAVEKLYQFTWHEFADLMIEQSKTLSNGNDPDIKYVKGALRFVLINVLKALHPFAPFSTEAIWQELFARQLVAEKLLITAQFTQP